jgi:hypothetical protein
MDRSKKGSSLLSPYNLHKWRSSKEIAPIQSPTDTINESKKTDNQMKDIMRRAVMNAKIKSYARLTQVKGMSSCLFIMDDTIRLMEWLAYHFTVLPMRYLIVGIDPHSLFPDRIIEVLERWKPYMNITIWRDPEIYLSNVPYDKAWKRKYWISPGVVNPLYNDTSSHGYRSQEHKRRQNIFTTYCYREHLAANRSWVINLDTDEYLIPNYFSDHEDGNASNFVIHYVGTKEKLDRDRRHAMDIREHLPALTKRITVSEILEQTEFDRCLKIPAINFTSQKGTKRYQGTIPGSEKLITLTQTKTGPREGRTTKAILDVSRAQLAYLTWEKFVNVHNPNKRMCGWNGVIGSGTDYISSAFRYHHYVAGSFEISLERAQDYRVRESGTEVMEHFESRNFEPISGETTDIFPWLDWFVDIMGRNLANDVLFSPIQERYREMRELYKEHFTISAS